MFDHNAGVEVLRQAGHFLHPLKPPHYLLVLTLSRHTPEVEFQVVTRTRQRLLGDDSIESAVDFAKESASLRHRQRVWPG